MKEVQEFLLNVGRIADALEVIAAAKSGADAPRQDKAATTTDTSAKDKAAKDKADKAAKDKADKEAKAKAAEKPKDADPLGDDKKTFTREEVLEKLKALIAQDGKAAAFEVLKEKGGGAENATKLKEEHFEDVYVECVERLG